MPSPIGEQVKAVECRAVGATASWVGGAGRAITFSFEQGFAKRRGLFWEHPDSSSNYRKSTCIKWLINGI
jgi:hypothetical protein